MRYKVKTKDCYLVVKAKASWGESVDEKAIEAFSRIYLRGFLKPKLIKKNQIEYSGPIGISLYERLKKPISKRDLLFILEQIVVAVQKIESNKLLLSQIVMDLHYVFINDITKELQFLYVPCGRESENPGIVGLIESIVYSVTPADEGDIDFISRFTHFIRAQEAFIPEEIEKYIAKEDRSVVNTIKKQNIGQSGFITNKRKIYYEHNGGQVVDPDLTDKLEEDDIDPTGKLEDDACDTGRIQDDEQTGKLIEDEMTDPMDDGYEPTGRLDECDDCCCVLPVQESENDTEYLNEERYVRYPTLRRVLTEEMICINKPVFRLGKENSYVDYFVSNNNAISRSHADIVTRGSKYFVIDLNSKNHTYINDQVLAVQCETEICDGDRLKLGNEEFVFNI